MWQQLCKTVRRGPGLLLAGLVLVLLARPAPAAPAQPVLVDYRVRRGDTVVKIARRLYGKPERADLILRHNDLGPPPYQLRPGQMLRVPPDAALTFARNRVGIFSDQQEEGKPSDPLLRSQRVSTMSASSAEITFSDDTQVQLGEQSLLMVAGKDLRRPRAGDTTLLQGRLRAQRTAPGDGHPVALATPGARIRFTTGAGLVQALGALGARVTVHRGEWVVSAAGKEVGVPAGFRTSIDYRHPPDAPLPLPAVPSWTQAPPPLVLTLSSSADVSFGFGGPAALSPSAPPAPDGAPARVPAAVQWHVQVARDVAFNDIVLDTSVPAGQGELTARGLREGVYFAQVSAVDAEQYESAPGPAARFEVTQVRVLPGGADHAAAAQIRSGLWCGLDGLPLAPVETPLVLGPARDHLLLCATAAGAATSQVNIDASRCGPLRAAVDLGAATVAGGLSRHRVVLRLQDGAGRPVTGVRVLASASGGARTGAVKEEAPGGYATVVESERGQGPVTVRFTLVGQEDVTADLPPVAAAPPTPSLPRPLLPPRPRPPLLELGLLGSLHLTDLHQGPPAPGIGLEFSARFGLPRGTLSVGLRVAAENYVYTGKVRAACTESAGVPPLLCIINDRGVYGFLIARALLTVTVPLTYRLRPPEALWTPYVGAAPQFIVDFAQTEVIGLVNRITYTQRPGIVGLLGAEVRPRIRRWTRSAFFLEAGYRYLPIEGPAPNEAALSGFMFFTGCRVQL